MSGPEIKGWCPSLFEPMAAGDGLLVRIKPRVAGIGAAQLKKLADAAEAYGSGQIEITNRANFQLRGLSAETVAPFAEAMHAAGLAGTDAATERRRNIIAAARAGAGHDGGRAASRGVAGSGWRVAAIAVEIRLCGGAGHGWSPIFVCSPMALRRW